MAGKERPGPMDCFPLRAGSFTGRGKRRGWMVRLGVEVGKVTLVFCHLYKVAAFYLAMDGRM